MKLLTLDNPEVVTTQNPHSSEVVLNIPCTSPSELAVMCQTAKQAFFEHGRVSTVLARSEALFGVARLIKEKKHEFARCEAADTGKSIAVALSEVEGAIALWEYAATLARSASSHAFPSSTSQGLALTYREPVGVVGLIVPWNYPLITTSERMPFAIGAGCAVILKPSEVAAGSLPLLIETILDSQLLPLGMVQIVYGTGLDAGQQLCVNSDVNMIAFVGSTKVGRIIESAATLTGKRVSAEMGGNNFVLIYADADLEAAARAVIAGGFRNAGQACIAGTHVLVDPRVANKFTEVLQQEFEKYRCVCDEYTQPLINQKHQENIISLINAAVAEGVCFFAGSSLQFESNKIMPVIFDNVPLSSVLFKNEIFGPVVTVSYLDQNEFINIVNHSEYGLAVYAWTASVTNALYNSKELRAGRIWVNAPPDYWLPELPVGGFGASGYGREMGLNGLETYSLNKSAIIF